MDIALLLLRLAVGGTVAAHGAQKLLGWFGGPGRPGTAQLLESLGYRPGGPWAWLLGGAELAGGVALAVGFLSPLAALAVAGVLLAAVVVVHWERGFFAAAGGIELPLVLASAALAVAFAGAGRWSVDHLVGWSLGGSPWGVVVTVAAVASAGAAATARGLLVSQRGGRPATT